MSEYETVELKPRTERTIGVKGSSERLLSAEFTVDEYGNVMTAKILNGWISDNVWLGHDGEGEHTLHLSVGNEVLVFPLDPQRMQIITA